MCLTHPILENKSDGASDIYREQGNKYYKTTTWLIASLWLYNKAIQHPEIV